MEQTAPKTREATVAIQSPIIPQPSKVIKRKLKATEERFVMMESTREGLVSPFPRKSQHTAFTMPIKG